MATERDPGSAERADLSRVDPVHDLTHEGVAGNPDRVPTSGTASVESRITGPESGTRNRTYTGGENYTGGDEDSESTVERVRGAVDTARERVSELGDRAGELAGRARDQLGGALDRAEHRLEEQTGVITIVRDYPLIAAGLAFGAGFLLASETGHRRRGLMGTATRQMRSALLGSATTLLVNELQDLLDEHGGPANLLRKVTGRESAEH